MFTKKSPKEETAGLERLAEIVNLIDWERLRKAYPAPPDRAEMFRLLSESRKPAEQERARLREEMDKLRAEMESTADPKRKHELSLELGPATSKWQRMCEILGGG